MFKLIEKENIILKRAKEANRLKQDIYIYGCGHMGQILAKLLLKNEISIKAYLVDGVYYQSNKLVEGLPVQNMDLYKPKRTDLVLIAMSKCSITKINELSQQCNVVNEDVYSFYFVDEIIGDVYKFCEDNIVGLSEFYESLSDEKSKEHMVAYFNQKISGKIGFLKDVWEENQYYDKDIVDFSRINSLVDCGAYDGDSYRSYMKNYEFNMSKKYGGGYYA
jgi:FlaA1/EpsC-like NDP-sugar epimerase